MCKSSAYCIKLCTVRVCICTTKAKRIRDWKATITCWLWWLSWTMPKYVCVYAHMCAHLCVPCGILTTVCSRGGPCLSNTSSWEGLGTPWSLGTVWGFHLQTQTVYSCTRPLECQGYVTLNLSSVCGIWPLRAKYRTLLRWFRSWGWWEHDILLQEILSRG